MRTTAICALVLALGCVANMPLRRTFFVAEEYAPYAESGIGSISGHVVQGVRIQKFAANRVVKLLPVTSHSAEWVDLHLIKNLFPEPDDPRIHAFTRWTTTDKHGAFTFCAFRPK